MYGHVFRPTKGKDEIEETHPLPSSKRAKSRIIQEKGGGGININSMFAKHKVVCDDVCILHLVNIEIQ